MLSSLLAADQHVNDIAGATRELSSTNLVTVTDHNLCQFAAGFLHYVSSAYCDVYDDVQGPGAFGDENSACCTGSEDSRTELKKAMTFFIDE